MVDIDNTIADYTNGLRDYIRECGRGEDECPCPEPTAYDFTLTGGWPFSGDAKAFTWWHTRAVADGLYSKEEPYEGAVDALNQLHDAGWNIIMATSRADDWRGESQRWLHRNGFQFDGYYNGDKTLLTPDVLIDDRPVTVTFSPACRGGGFLLKNPNGFSIDRLSPHALWFARFMSRATR